MSNAHEAEDTFNSGEEVVNHEEAFELACVKRAESNLARCYLNLRSRVSLPDGGEDPVVEALRAAGQKLDRIDDVIAAIRANDDRVRVETVEACAKICDRIDAQSVNSDAAMCAREIRRMAKAKGGG